VPEPEFVVRIQSVGEIAGSGPTGLAALALCLVALLAAIGLAGWLLSSSETLRRLFASLWSGAGR
jgi:hypothetical protein